MKKTEIVKQAYRAMESGDTAKAYSLMSEDFTISGPFPKTFNREEFVDMMGSLVAGLPDFKFNEDNLKEEEGVVTSTVEVSGTHTRDLYLPGMEPVPATGLFVKNPVEGIVYTFDSDNRIHSIEVEKVPGAGLDGLVSQLREPAAILM